MPKMVTRICQNRKCGCEFQARQADVNRGWARFCSKSCKAVVQERRNGQHAAFLRGQGVSNLHPERLVDYGGDDTHPFSPDGLGQWMD